jgi:hypothetical protein
MVTDISEGEEIEAIQKSSRSQCIESNGCGAAGALDATYPEGESTPRGRGE